jgi:hypothetical protein
MKRVLKAMIVFRRPAITLGWPANIAAIPTSATTADDSIVRRNDQQCRIHI